MCTCFPEFGLLFNRSNRPVKGPTVSILQGAKTAIACYKEQAQRSPTAGQIYNASDVELMRPTAYLQINENLGTRAEAFPATGSGSKEIPHGSVFVRHDVHVDTE